MDIPTGARAHHHHRGAPPSATHGTHQRWWIAAAAAVVTACIILYTDDGRRRGLVLVEHQYAAAAASRSAAVTLPPIDPLLHPTIRGSVHRTPRLLRWRRKWRRRQRLRRRWRRTPFLQNNQLYYNMVGGLPARHHPAIAHTHTHTQRHTYTQQHTHSVADTDLSRRSFGVRWLTSFNNNNIIIMTKTALSFNK